METKSTDRLTRFVRLFDDEKDIVWIFFGRFLAHLHLFEHLCHREHEAAEVLARFRVVEPLGEQGEIRLLTIRAKDRRLSAKKHNTLVFHLLSPFVAMG
jgi:hypothetical protein